MLGGGRLRGQEKVLLTTKLHCEEETRKKPRVNARPGDLPEELARLPAIPVGLLGPAPSHLTQPSPPKSRDHKCVPRLTLKVLGVWDGWVGGGLLGQFCNFPVQSPRPRSHNELAKPLGHSTEPKRSGQSPNVKAALGWRGLSWPLTSARSHLPWPRPHCSQQPRGHPGASSHAAQL